jgi:hypothetical protein
MLGARFFPGSRNFTLRVRQDRGCKAELNHIRRARACAHVREAESQRAACFRMWETPHVTYIALR